MSDFRLDHLSHTQVRTYLICGVRYYLRYRRGLIVPPSAAMTLGSATDQAANANYRQKIHTGEDLPARDLEEIFVEDLQARREETIWTPADGDGYQQVETQGRKMIRVMREDLMPGVQPAGVQEKIEFGFENDAVTFIGYSDLRTGAGSVGGEAVVDLKTSTRVPTIEGNVMQMTGYVIGSRLCFGMQSRKAGIHAVIRSKKTGDCYATKANLEFEITEEDEKFWLWKVQSALKGIRAGIFNPAADASQCNPRWCGYWKICRAQNKGGQDEI